MGEKGKISLYLGGKYHFGKNGVEQKISYFGKNKLLTCRVTFIVDISSPLMLFAYFCILSTKLPGRFVKFASDFLKENMYRR